MNQSVLTVEQAMEATQLSRSKFYKLLNLGTISARKLGRRTFILQDDINNYLQSLTLYPTKASVGVV